MRADQRGGKSAHAPQNNGKYWLESEESLMLREFNRDALFGETVAKKITRLAKLLGRTELSIELRLALLGRLPQSYRDTTRFSEPLTRTAQPLGHLLYADADKAMASAQEKMCKKKEE